MNWLQELDKATEEAETPRSYVFWGGIAAISAVASTNVYMNKSGVYELRPNLFILLIGRSGLGKGLPITIAKRLVKLVNTTRVISGRSTIEGVLTDLSKTKSKEDGSPMLKDARGFIVSGEFATSLQRNPDGLTILTDLYDTHYQDEWVNTLKTSPTEKLINPCITLFSGASPAHFEDFIPKANMYGGFLGRTILVYEEKRYKVNALTDDDAIMIDYSYLADHLKEISKVTGKMRWSFKGKEYYQAWYERIKKKDIQDKTGTIDRIQDHVCKVAMCISLAKKLDRVIEEEDIIEAIAACGSIHNTAKRMTSGAGQSSMAAQTKTALEIIMRSPELKVKRSELLAKGMGDFTASELDQIIETLAQTNFIKQTGVKDISYEITPNGKELWGRVNERKQ